MANITAKEVAALRERTGVGMMDCKKALVESDGDMEKAITVLREKGLAAAAKKAGRIAAEGIVISLVDNNKKIGTVLEINSETDFVAKNEIFTEFVKTVAEIIIEKNPADIDALNECTVGDTNSTVAELLRDKILVIGENLKIRRFVRMEGVLISYVHGNGRIGVLVKIDSSLDDNNEGMLACGKEVALQIAASNPLYLDQKAVPASVIDDEKEILLTQIKNDPKMANKPEQIITKMVEGRIGKYYKENCLVEQLFIKDTEISVGKHLENCSKDLGGAITVAEFVRFEKGEGLQKRDDNFADEVANMIK